MNDKERQKNSSVRIFPVSGEVKPCGNAGRANSLIAKQLSKSPMFNHSLMEEICNRSNLQTALKRVKKNRGSPGVDGMTVEQLPDYLKTNWLLLKERLLKGDYKPNLIRRVEIPKPHGKDKRKLGIPCVLDRFIQQAILQVLQAKWDKEFSDSSYGFRPNRSAHQAVAKAQTHLKQGYSYVVDIDLENFFNKICHDKLMSTLAKEIEDKRVLKLIRSFLNAGIMEGGLVSTPTEGAAQGSPLSPLLSNIVLDELDKELEKRGHKHVRYGDDCNIYVQSKRAGERVMSSISYYISKRLKLKVNISKSAVALPQERKFLGFSFTGGKYPNKRKIAPQSLKKFKDTIRQLTNRNHSISIETRIERLSIYLRGWIGYFKFCETFSILRDLDSWIRRRLRAVLWKQWKVYKKRKSELIKRGVREDLAQSTAWSTKGCWNICNTPGVRIALPNSYFDSLKLPRLYPGQNI